MKLSDIVKKTAITAMTAFTLAGCIRMEEGYIKRVGELKINHNTAQFDLIIQTRHGLDTLSVYGPLLDTDYMHAKAAGVNYVTTKELEPDKTSRIDVSPSEITYHIY